MPPCVFCRIVADDDDRVLVLRDERVVGFLDIRPVFAGHVLVVPRDHVVTLDELPLDDAVPLLDAVQRTMRALPDAVGAEGTFVAVNNRISQSVAHLHVHVVPRRKGDGLKGFFWPRHPYASDADLDDVRARVRAAITAPGR